MNTFKTYRETMKLTQEELAELLEISPRQLQRIENKENKFNYIFNYTDNINICINTTF